MKWRGHRVGETRVVRKFAWWPVSCHNGKVVWLEMYSSVERFQIGFEWEGWESVERWAD